jgi:hypothetical protein
MMPPRNGGRRGAPTSSNMGAAEMKSFLMLTGRARFESEDDLGADVAAREGGGALGVVVRRK